jgi:hypothetical protein
MTTTGGGSHPAGGDGNAVGESTQHRHGSGTIPIAYIACPVCRAPIALPDDELPPRLVCESCGAILER